GRDLESRLAMPERATACERLDFVERVLLREGVALLPRVMPTAAVGLVLLPIAGKLLGDDATADELQTVTRGLPHNVTTEMNLALWGLASRIRQEPGAAAVLLGGSPDSLAERFRSGALPV